MKNKYVFFIFLIIALFLFSRCNGFIYHKNIDNIYAIIAVDILSDASVCRKVCGIYEGRIDYNVGEVGKFRSVIYAKKNDGTFWILDRTKDNDNARPEDCVTGPYDITNFRKELKRIGLRSPPEFKWKVK